jgi:hypothetical protein
MQEQETVLITYTHDPALLDVLANDDTRKLQCHIKRAVGLEFKCKGCGRKQILTFEEWHRMKAIMYQAPAPLIMIWCIDGKLAFATPNVEYEGLHQTRLALAFMQRSGRIAIATTFRRLTGDGENNGYKGVSNQ